MQLSAVEHVRQRRQANAAELRNVVVLAIVVDIVDQCLELRRRILCAGLVLVGVDNAALAPEIELIERDRLPLAGVDDLCAAVRRLEQLEHLVVANLEIGAARLLDLRRERRLDHLVAVLLGLDLQTQTELRVAPDLVIHNAGRLLRGEDEVDTERAADARRRNDLLHEIGILRFQLSKLIGNDDQVRDRLGDNAFFIQTDIIVDVIDGVAHSQRGLRKQRLPLDKLRLDRAQRAVDLAAVDVRDRTEHMRKVTELARHAAALEVDDHKGDLVRVEQRRHGQDIRLQDLRFTGARCAGHKTVRSVR